jgi:hypothetical protein
MSAPGPGSEVQTWLCWRQLSYAFQTAHQGSVKGTEMTVTQKASTAEKLHSEIGEGRETQGKEHDCPDVFDLHAPGLGLETVAVPDSVSSDFNSASLALARCIEMAVVSIQPVLACPDLALLHQLELLLDAGFLLFTPSDKAIRC